MRRKTMVTVWLLAIALFLAACGAAGQKQEEAGRTTGKAKEEKTEQLRVALWSQPITEQTNLLAEKEKGFFKEKGLNVTLIPGAGGGDAIKNILSGQADIAFTDPGSLFFALDKGAKLKVIYNIYPQNVFNVVSLKDKQITKPEDLKGKKIGVYSLSSGTRQNLLVLLHQAGLSENDVTIVETGLLNFAPLMQGQVDATAATDTGLVMAKEKGLGDVNVIEVKNYLNIPSDVFVVTEKTYNEKKELLQKFLEAYRNSAQWMIDHPEEAASLAVKYAIDGKDEQRNLQIIQLRNASSVSPLTEEKGLGALDVNVLQQAANTYKTLGLIKNDIHMAEVVTNELLPKQ
ncbi:nitrate ABC transporter substrate-binding protein [Geobacillus subterraneus]|uniref:Nitrate ABC transporter substrate-binding protein n=2 Tax=Geobacillus TaxID=129337 RepID=A0ABM6AAN1_9BACL|nr:MULTISPECIES: ABC transporter substrate-binding protein [Geobacillus]AMX83303.1 nitrate ABC transporter substrate-binding protein [Geobacillus subterraneus]KZS24972.1 nitrate ABC transporter substrate-binding protein [Geobacillus subterraneus]OXB90320.1 nitrate ABC transporter substrate-binding protein [Geobacillus uzenensis]QIZ68098.1 ABC transporter substrate-binding protein [Geobacillus subterraneus]WPZ17108.1 ABC transporter substrate-binding protein [Geobacillus subterraneus]